MAKFYTGDPLADFNKWDEDNERWLNSRPICDCCRERIQDEYGYRVDGMLYCEQCIDKCKEWLDE